MRQLYRPHIDPRTWNIFIFFWTIAIIIPSSFIDCMCQFRMSLVCGNLFVILLHLIGGYKALFRYFGAPVFRRALMIFICGSLLVNFAIFSQSRKGEKRREKVPLPLVFKSVEGVLPISYIYFSVSLNLFFIFSLKIHFLINSDI